MCWLALSHTYSSCQENTVCELSGHVHWQFKVAESNIPIEDEIVYVRIKALRI